MYDNMSWNNTKSTHTGRALTIEKANTDAGFGCACNRLFLNNCDKIFSVGSQRKNMLTANDVCTDNRHRSAVHSRAEVQCFQG